MFELVKRTSAMRRSSAVVVNAWDKAADRYGDPSVRRAWQRLNWRATG
jgi:hypothetical protein